MSLSSGDMGERCRNRVSGNKRARDQLEISGEQTGLKITQQIPLWEKRPTSDPHPHLSSPQPTYCHTTWNLKQLWEEGVFSLN